METEIYIQMGPTIEGECKLAQQWKNHNEDETSKSSIEEFYPNHVRWIFDVYHNISWYKFCLYSEIIIFLNNFKQNVSIVS